MSFQSMGDEKDRKKANDEQENGENNDQDADVSDDFTLEITEYVRALYQFSSMVNELDWPETNPLDNDAKLLNRVFRDFWHQRIRQRRSQRDASSRHNTYRIQGINPEDFHAFFRRKFLNEPDEEPRFIDAKEHEPDEEHTETEAKERQQRFRDEWE